MSSANLLLNSICESKMCIEFFCCWSYVLHMYLTISKRSHKNAKKTFNNTTQDNPRKVEHNATRPDPWVNPTHDHLWSEVRLDLLDRSHSVHQRNQVLWQIKTKLYIRPKVSEITESFDGNIYRIYDLTTWICDIDMRQCIQTLFPAVRLSDWPPLALVLFRQPEPASRTRYTTARHLCLVVDCL